MVKMFDLNSIYLSLNPGVLQGSGVCGPYLAMLNCYSSHWSKELLLLNLGVLWDAGIELRLVTYKANSLHIILSLWPRELSSFIKEQKMYAVTLVSWIGTFT